MLYLPCYFHILLAVISEIVSYRARIIFTSDQEVMHIVHDVKFVVHVFLSGCYFHLYIHIDQGWFLLNVIKSFHFYYKDAVYSTFDVDDIIEAPSLSQTLSRQFVFPLCGKLFCSLYFIMWWILWIRLILLSAGFIITLVWSKQLMMKVFTNYCLRDKTIHLVFLIFSSLLESWVFIWNYKNMVEFSDC